jgi:hypothetical protein
MSADDCLHLIAALVPFAITLAGAGGFEPACHDRRRDFISLRAAQRVQRPVVDHTPPGALTCRYRASSASDRFLCTDSSAQIPIIERLPAV